MKERARPKIKTDSLKILKLSAYCYPELESSSHLTDDLYEAYRDAGFYVENYVPTPTRGVSDNIRKEYRRKKKEILYDGHVIIHRFSMFREGKNPIGRAFRYLLVNIIQYWKGIHAKDIDIVYSGSTPPTQGMLCALVKRKLTKKYKRPVAMIFAIQDIFPDSLVGSGLTKPGSLLWKLGNRISAFAYENADHIITITEALKHNLIEKGVPEEKVTVVSNWIDTDIVKHIDRENNPLFDEFGLDRNKFIVLYAGNLGAAQGGMVIAETARKLKSEKQIYFVIFGEGSERDRIIRECQGLKNIEIHEFLPVEKVSEVYSLGNIALIICKKGIGRSSMPSKTWSIMACNTPIIASFDLKSPLAQILKEANAGVCVEAEDSEALASAINSVFLEWKRNSSIAIDTRTYVFENASKEACTRKYVDIIRDCVFTNGK